MSAEITSDEAQTLVTSRQRFGDYVYTPLEKVIEVWRRRQNARYTGSRQETVLGASVPPVLQGNTPVGVLFRQIGTPNYETRRVARLCAQHGIRLVIWEYHEDLFATENRDKYALGRLGFYSGLGRNGGRRLEYTRVFDVELMNRRRFCDIVTYRGEALIDFHHRLLAAECPELKGDALFDASDWFRKHGGNARDYYAAFISLFLRHAILFETFVLQGGECDFTRDVFLPVFQSLYQTSGVKPLVVQAESEDWEGDDFWHLYPEPLRHHLGPFRVRDHVANDTGLNWVTPEVREPVSTVARGPTGLVPSTTPAAVLQLAVGAGAQDI